jgi:ACS family sodium-dependent inorganic phosphate cotransporter
MKVADTFLIYRLNAYFSLSGTIPAAIFLLIIAYIGCARVATTVLLILSIVTSGIIFVGHLCNQNDLAPNYAGILMGITNTPGSISAFILPPIIGALVADGVSKHL